MKVTSNAVRAALGILAAASMMWSASISAVAAPKGWCEFINTRTMTRQSAVHDLHANGCLNVIVHIRCDGNPANFGHVVDQRPGALANQRPNNPDPDKIYVPSHRRIQLWVGVRMNGPTDQPTSTHCPGELPAPTTTTAPRLADLDGTYGVAFTPTWAFDDITVLNVPLPLTMTISNGQIGGDFTGQVDWTGASGSARVMTHQFQADCSGNWGFQVDRESHLVTVTGLGLECRGPSTYSTGAAVVTRQ